MNIHVEDWQRALNAAGFPVGAIDGDFGPATLAASKLALEAAIAEPEPDKSAMATTPDDGTRNAITLRATQRPVNELIWHCAATPEGRDFTVADIRAWHRKRGFADIGYHYVVYRDGSIHIGRSIDEIGAHVSGHNTGTIGASYIGGVAADGRTAKDTRTPEQRASMRWLTKALVSLHDLNRISGHNQYAAKACPSFDVRTDELGNLPGWRRGTKT